MSPQVCVLVLIFAISAYAAAAGAQSWVQQVQGSSNGTQSVSISFKSPVEIALLKGLAIKTSLVKCSVLNFWVKNGPDGTGGFHATLNRAGNPIAPTDKNLVGMSRHLWSFSQFAATQHGRPTAVKELADGLAGFLMKHMVDRADGSFHSGVTQDGSKVTTNRKDFYDQTVPIFALAKYAATTGSPAALKAAKQAWSVWDAALYDSAQGGYADGSVSGNVTVTALGASKVALTAQRSKTLNTQLHALLMVMDLAKADPTFDAAGSRLADLVKVLTQKMVVNTTAGVPFVAMSCAHNYANCSTGSVSYGLTAEWVWYVDAAVELLVRQGRMTPAAAATARGVLVSVGSKALADYGFDTIYGGVFRSGVVGNASSASTDKHWWVQLESSLAFFKLWQLTGDISFLAKADNSLGFLTTKLWDPLHGEVLAGSDRMGSIVKEWDCGGGFKPDASQIKACGGKASWHTGRALVQLWLWLLDEGTSGMSTCIS